jgi:uncharacterized protein (DUF2141 family)
MGLSPGVYRIEARGETRDAAGQSVVLWGAAETTLTGGASPVLAVVLEQAPSVRGHITFDEPADLAAPSTLDVTLEPADPVSGSFKTTIAAKVDRDEFTFAAVPPGRYRLRAVDRANGARAWHLASARISDHDVVDAPFELHPGESVSDAVVSMTHRVGEVSGKLVDAAGQLTTAYTVVVFSADDQNWYWNSSRIRAAHLGTDGSYVVNDLPAGTYLISALTDVDESDWFDPEFLGRIRSAAVSVTLVAGTPVTQNLRIAGGRD